MSVQQLLTLMLTDMVEIIITILIILSYTLAAWSSTTEVSQQLLDGEGIYVPLRINYNNSGDPLTCQTTIPTKIEILFTPSAISPLNSVKHACFSLLFTDIVTIVLHVFTFYYCVYGLSCVSCTVLLFLLLLRQNQLPLGTK